MGGQAGTSHSELRSVYLRERGPIPDSEVGKSVQIQQKKKKKKKKRAINEFPVGKP